VLHAVLPVEMQILRYLKYYIIFWSFS